MGELAGRGRSIIVRYTIDSVGAVHIRRVGERIY